MILTSSRQNKLYGLSIIESSTRYIFNSTFTIFLKIFCFIVSFFVSIPVLFQLFRFFMCEINFHKLNFIELLLGRYRRFFFRLSFHLICMVLHSVFRLQFVHIYQFNRWNEVYQILRQLFKLNLLFFIKYICY